jgi:hypothetical protein
MIEAERLLRESGVERFLRLKYHRVGSSSLRTPENMRGIVSATAIVSYASAWSTTTTLTMKGCKYLQQLGQFLFIFHPTSRLTLTSYE